MISRRSFGSAVALSALILAAGLRQPSPGQAAEEPRRGGTLNAIIQPEPVSLTAAVLAAAPTGIVGGNIFDGLVRYDLDLKPQPELATRWEVSPDGRTITFHLREGVTWHDGQPFTSADVAWSLENVWKPLNPRNPALFRNITRADTPDPHTVVFHLVEPSIALFGLLNGNGAQILPRHLYEGTNVLTNPYNLKPIGTGPFVFKEWVKGSHILLERNPHYWDAGKPYLDRIVFRVMPDGAARAAALEKGEIHYAPLSPIPLRDAERLAKLPTIRVGTAGYEWLTPWLYLDFNVQSEHFKDARVRRAVAHAIDRDALIKVVWFGFGKAAISPVSSSLKAFHNPDVPLYPFDPKRAEALLDEAGLKRGSDGVRFTIAHDYLPYGEDYRRTGEFVKAALKRVGVDVTLRGQDTAAFTRRVYGERDFDLSSSWSSAFPDPQLGVARLYNSEFVGRNVPWSNGSGFRNPEVDAIFKAAETELDAERRIAAWKRFQVIAQTELPTLPLVELKFFNVYSAKLRNAVTRGDQIFGPLTEAWLDEPAKSQ